MKIDKNVLKQKYYQNKNYYESLREHHLSADERVNIDKEIRPLLIKAISALMSESKVLEVGCGEGSIVCWLANQFPDINFIGTDVSDCAIELANGFNARPKNIEYFTDDIEMSEIADQSVSVILLHYVIEHCSDLDKVIGQCNRILKQGGEIIIGVENGGRKNKGQIGFIKDAFRFLFRMNKIEYKNPTFKLDSDTEEIKRIQHRTNFDLLDIPSDVLLSILKREGFRIINFSTHKKDMIENDKYRDDSWFKKAMKILYVYCDIFPLNHMGYVTIVSAKKNERRI